MTSFFIRFNIIIMSNQTSFALRIKKFDFTHGLITLPQESAWYRAYAPDIPVLTTEPLFFGDIDVAYMNAKPHKRRLGEFQCVRPLRVLDIRYVMSFLPFVFRKNAPQKNMMQKITLALGLCSFEKQIELLQELPVDRYPLLPHNIRRMNEFNKLEVKPDWTNPIELRGVRVGITDIDYEVMMWLKELLLHVADGIIAPALPTPFHDQMFQDVSRSVMYEELILFEPRKAVRFLCDRPVTNKLIYYLPTGAFQQVLEHHEQLVLDAKPIRYSRNTHQRGGDDTSLIKDEMGEKLEMDDKLKKEMAKTKRRWKRDIVRIQKSQQFLQHVFLPLKCDVYAT
jgi:hypothetical protein